MAAISSPTTSRTGSVPTRRLRTEAMRAAILAHRYELQYALYLLALHRLLKAGCPTTTTTGTSARRVPLPSRQPCARSRRALRAATQALIEALDRLLAGAPVPSHERPDHPLGGARLAASSRHSVCDFLRREVPRGESWLISPRRSQPSARPRPRLPRPPAALDDPASRCRCRRGASEGDVTATSFRIGC